MEFKGWVTDQTRCSFQGLTVNEVMKFIGDLQKMVPNEFHQYIDWNKTRTEQGNWPTKTIVKLQFKNETNLATMIGLLKIGKDELKKMPCKLHEQEEVSARLEMSLKETSGKGTRSVSQRPQRSENESKINAVSGKIQIIFFV